MTDQHEGRTAGRHGPLWAIILLGTTLRLYNLTYHSLWFDEAISVRWATSSLARIWEVSMTLVEDRLPPLYYLLLKFWLGLAGSSEFSLRFPSVVAGVLLIPVVYAIGRRLFGRAVGLLAALLTALNPFLIWYSQEARMYALAVLLATAGVLCFLLAISRPPPRHLAWLGLGLAALAGLYTHLYSGFLWPALALWLVARPGLFKRVWWPFGLTMAGVLALFSPLALAIWRFSGESTPGQPLLGLGGRALDLFRAFIIWQAPLSLQMGQWLTLGLGLFLLLGLGWGVRQAGGWLVILLGLMPFAIASLLLFRSELAFFGHRYFIVMLPWLLLLQALGAVKVLAVGRRVLGIGYWILAGGLVVVLVGLTAWPVPGQWSPGAAKEVWRQSLVYLKTHARPEDAVFIHPEWVRFPYQYYQDRLQVPGQTYASFFAVDPATDLDGPLNGVVARHGVVWLIQSHLELPDPERRVEGWFAARYPLVTELYPPGLILKGYAPGYQLTARPARARAVEIDFAAGLRLVGYELAQRRLSAQDALFHPPSNWIHLTLYWTGSAVGPDVVPYAHLLDDQGQVWGASLERAGDALRLYPPSRWTAGQVIRQDLDVNLNPAAPSGRYQLVAGVGQEKAFVAEITLTD